MVRSRETIEYLRRNLNFENCVSMFVVGSIPDELKPQSDLDIFIVIDGKEKDAFFNNLTEIMDKYVENRSGIIYSLFRGPIKFEDRGLIHFLVYTESDEYDVENKELFVNEHSAVLRSLLKNGKVLHGKSFKELLKGINLKSINKIKENKNRLREKLRILREKNYVDFPEWKKTSGGWKLLRTKKKTDGFLKEYLIGYFEKHL